MKTVFASIVILTLGLGQPSLAQGQWSRITEVPATDIYSVKSVNGTLYAGAEKQIYFSSANSAWITTTEIHPEVNSIETLAFYQNKLYAGTGGKGIFVSNDNGTTWEHSGLGDLYLSEMLQIGQDLYATTDDAGIFRLQGANLGQWQSINNGIWFSSVSSIAATSQQIVATLSGNDFVYLLDQNTTTWNSQPFATPYNPNIATNELIAAGDILFAGTDYGVYTSTDHGLTWTKDNEGMPRGNWVEFVVKNNIIFAAVNKLNQTHLFYRSIHTPTGTTWNHLFTEPGWSYDIAEANGKLYFGTGAGLFTFDVSGVVSAPEEEESVAQNLGYPYPNPASDLVEIPISLPAGTNSAILEMRELSTGRLLDQINLSTIQSSGTVKLTTNNYPAGMYSCTLKIGNKISVVRKLVITR